MDAFLAQMEIWGIPLGAIHIRKIAAKDRRYKILDRVEYAYLEDNSGYPFPIAHGQPGAIKLVESGLNLFDEIRSGSPSGQSPEVKRLLEAAKSRNNVTNLFDIETQRDLPYAA